MRTTVAALLIANGACSAQAMNIATAIQTTVRVQAEQPDGSISIGSGVVLPGQRVATACHVVAGAKALKASYQYVASPATVLRRDDWRDLCVLSVPGLAAPAAKTWLPFVYRADISATGWAFYWEHIKQSIMPVTVLGLFQGAALVRFVRSSVLDVIRLDYVTTARSKGIGERKVITRHVVRTALIPVVTLVALQMPIVFSGAIVTEQIFRVPGIGSLLISSMLANDTPVVMGVTFVSACLVVIFNLIADILYGWLDPRIAFR